MICDLCREDSDEVVHVTSWTICRWCVTNDDRPLAAESVRLQLSEDVATTSASLQRDAIDVAVAESEVEAAYAHLTSALHELASTREHSRNSLEKARAARAALEEYGDRGRRGLREHA